MPQATISLHNKEFAPYLPEAQITAAVRDLAARINRDYAGQTPLFVAVLNGSFMFAADLLKDVTLDCEVAFIRVASYAGTSTTGEVKEILGLQEDVQGRHLIIVEDIVDTGHTMQAMLQQLRAQQPASVEVATLLIKPDCLQHELHIKYQGLAIPNDFVVGYGLDYDGLGRNYRDLYRVV
ncbi:hypoxanthine phosphoribosyltransferase [Hymenobacter busanensis]|uniref:Hypoxanthine phosphoribosyltransferase n=1 Tax=Hymenobacter busanensis TaxID=2607656 RepID=A0A7L4ZWZ5_9BACT|nr:hypoxanthine phosphoribosyltransferase [Hymenobacter busanensis]KAA9332288.1 hypoxanthine phosphoribosyltransferase [Hymenobacter busanensis]QHJ07375.1 hypoxanthine phosphoribosyltransferase [Hymenobacter busanensis]